MIKVAGYCRVSTDQEDQINSFESQKRFFRDYIQMQHGWELYEIYADEGVTGTSRKKRASFNRMMNDAYAGKFQRIITKEVSRFSRNILDTIACTRELKALGIGVYFMSDGFCTLDPDAELRLSIMGSIAQEESRKTSSRVKWGQSRQMERGVVFGTSMLGYDVKNGKLTVNPEGAAIVRLIFHKYGKEKKGITTIARELCEAGYKTTTGNPHWSNSYLLKILKNEKYVGDLVQKKTITPDYLTHDKKYNHGEEPLIMHNNHHEHIISRELWDTVQDEISRRNRNNRFPSGHSNRYVFSGKMKCAECGASFVSRTKNRKDGTSCRRWGCLTAVRHGSSRGCDVGKLIRDDLAMDMLIFAIRNIPADFGWMIRNVTLLAEKAIRACKAPDKPENIRQRIAVLRENRIKAIEAYLQNTISEEDLKIMKSRYDDETVSLKQRLTDAERNTAEYTYDELYKTAESIVSCREICQPYLKLLLEYMVVHKDGRVEVKLNHLTTVWHFRLEKQ